MEGGEVIIIYKPGENQQLQIFQGYARSINIRQDYETLVSHGANVPTYIPTEMNMDLEAYVRKIESVKDLDEFRRS